MADTLRGRAQRMANEGRNAMEISQELDIDYWEVWNLVPQTWQGTKSMITRRINRLVSATDPAIRQELSKEVKAYINYLYYGGKRLGRKVDRARKVLDE